MASNNEIRTKNALRKVQALAQQARAALEGLEQIYQDQQAGFFDVNSIADQNLEAAQLQVSDLTVFNNLLNGAHDAYQNKLMSQLREVV